MNPTINKNGTVYKYMKKHRSAYAAVVVLIAIFFVYTLMGAMPYILTAVNGSTPLDRERYQKECKTEQYPQPFEFHRGDDKSIPNYAVKKTSYWQDNKYEFSLTLTDVKKTGITYTTQTTGSISKDDMESAVVYSTDIAGIKTYVLAYPDTNYKPGDTITGIFNKMPQIIKYNLAENSKSVKESDTIGAYIFDTRGIEMDSAGFDMTFCVILLIIIIFLGVKLAYQFVNPLSAPTYSQLGKYGDILSVADNVDSEIAAANKKISKKELITDSWIISDDVFKLKIVKNHLKFGNIEYVSVDKK